ncbi:ribonuclease H-like domain-containing protein [Pavlovales sp. CCMP2436]|nr:ribonuclease H-like domain-containing protein [Pavlovales sp. CCMP2436]
MAPPEQPNWKRLQEVLRGKSGAASEITAAAAGPPPPPPAPAGPVSSLLTGVSITDKLGIDCEMVGVGADGARSVLARVVVVNWDGQKVYDALVRPRERVTDFRTWVTGITAKDLRKGRDFFEVQKEVAELIRNRMLIGHALHNDLSVLMLSHPKASIRDTSQYVPLRSSAAKQTGKSHPRALRKLAQEELGMQIQTGAHDPTEDAVASLLLYRRHANEWEKALRGGSKGRALVIRGAKVKRKSLTLEQRQVQDKRRQREMRERARTAGAAPAAGADPSSRAKAARVEAALPAPRASGRGANSRPSFLH